MKIKTQMALREIAGEYCLIPLEPLPQQPNGGIVALNETAAAIWKLLPDAEDEASIAAALAEEYETDAESAKRDVSELLDKFREMGIL